MNTYLRECEHQYEYAIQFCSEKSIISMPPLITFKMGMRYLAQC